MRQYGEVPPWLAPLNTPSVGAVTGLGTGGGACVQTPDSGGFGEVRVYPGKGAASSGSVALVFPNTPPTLFIAADWATVTQATVGNTVTISWTGANLVNNGKHVKIAYEWSVSQ